MGCFQTKRLNCTIVKEILNERRLSLTRRAILIKILNGENMEENDIYLLCLPDFYPIRDYWNRYIEL